MMAINNISKLYRRVFPENIRVSIRNIQWRFDHLSFLLKYANRSLRQRPSRSVTKKTSKPSICYIIPTTNITGGVAVVCEHLNRLKALGYKVLITSTDNKTDLSWFPKQTVRTIPFKGNKKNIENYDIVVATGWITAYELALLNVKRKIYFVQSDETRFYPKKSFLKNRVEYTYHFPFEYMTEAKWIKKWLKEKYDHEAELVPNGINTDIFYPDTPLEPKPKNKKRILLEGAINLSFKGMQEAFEVVQDLDCEVWCVSYDGKPKPEWHCDRFFEKVPMEMMRRIYSSCDILLKLSRVEGFFGPPLEMMACGGVPIVAKVAGYDEYIKDGYNALVTKVDNTKKTRELLQNLINNSTNYHQLKHNAQTTVNIMSWNRTIKKIIRLIS